MAIDINTCKLCGLFVLTREHHLIPRAKRGKETIACCETCESQIHKIWTHNQLRDTYNSVESILASPDFQSFLKWRKKQSPTTIFKSSTGRFRDKNKYH